MSPDDLRTMLRFSCLGGILIGLMGALEEACVREEFLWIKRQLMWSIVSWPVMIRSAAVSATDEIFYSQYLSTFVQSAAPKIAVTKNGKRRSLSSLSFCFHGEIPLQAIIHVTSLSSNMFRSKKVPCNKGERKTLSFNEPTAPPRTSRGQIRANKR